MFLFVWPLTLLQRYSVIPCLLFVWRVWYIYLLLMEEILHQLIGSLTQYLQGFFPSQVVQDFFHQQYLSECVLNDLGLQLGPPPLLKPHEWRLDTSSNILKACFFWCVLYISCSWFVAFIGMYFYVFIGNVLGKHWICSFSQNGSCNWNVTMKVVPWTPLEG